MEKVALMSSVVIALIFVLGNISSHLSSRQDAKRLSRPSFRGKSQKQNDDLMAGITTPNNPSLAGASFGGSGIGSMTDNRMREVSAKAVGE